ncbi:MAG: hypothetical protein M1835_006694 [Candelina submexicana]|nr:MAG: hypothetical protein M1835_006694 [Candelina submexicana]
MLAKPTPTPSKGALRVLRHIACAGTFGGTALMVEDRRRRIRLAREIQNNAKKIRSCRQYHGAAAAIAEYDILASPETEEQEHDEPSYQGWHRHLPFLPSEVQKAYESVERSRLRPSRKRPPSPSLSPNTRITVSQARPDQNILEQVVSPVEISDRNSSGLLGGTLGKQDLTTTKVLRLEGHIEPSIPSPCDLAAERISRFLKKDLSVAGKAYFGYFEADPTGRDVSRKFVKAALRLSFASKKADNHWMVQRIHDQLPECGLPSPRQKIEELLLSSKTQEAITLFLRIFEKKRPIHEKTAILASRLCVAALPLKLHKEIEDVFWRIYTTGTMRAECWETALKALAERREHGQVKSVYNLFKDAYPLSSTGYELVVRAMAAQGRLDDAREVLQRFLETKGQVAKHGYIIVLEECWRATRNFGRTKDVFEGMRSWSPDYEHTVSSYNAIISICVEAGREVEAREYLQEMIKVRGLQADLQTQGHFMLSEALKNNWSVVVTMLDHIYDKSSVGMASGDAKALLSTVNRLLKEYLKYHTARETEDFLWNMIGKHDFVPNKATSEIIVTGHVKSGDLASVFSWIKSVRKYGLKLDSAMSSAMFKHYWRTNRVSHRRLWYIYNNLKSIDKGLVSDQFLNVMRDAISYDLRKRRPEARDSNVIAGRLVSLGRERVSPDIYDRKFTQRQMLLAMSLKNPLKAVQIYEASKARGLSLNSADLEIAVECSIRANQGSFDAAVELLQSAQKAGMNIQGALTPILIHGTYRRQNKDEELTGTAVEFYNMLEKNNIRIKHHVAVSTANRLINRGDPRGALNLLSKVSRLPLAEKEPLNIVGMTIFLRAYAALRDLVGVEWVVRTVFQRKLRVDHWFLKTLKNVKKPIWAMKRTLLEGSDAFSNCLRLLELLDIWILEVRQKMVELSDEAKRQGKALVQVVKSLHTEQKSLLAPKESVMSTRSAGHNDSAQDLHQLL